MKKIRITLGKLFLRVVMLLLLLFSSFFIISCRKDDGILNDREVIEKFISYSSFSDFNDVNNNAQNAISKYENKSIDPEPVLIIAHISGITEKPKATILLLTYDEDGDLSGILIKEKSFDSRGKEKYIEEDYPIFKNWSPLKGAFPLIIFPSIRKSEQIKSEELWGKYIDGVSVEMDKLTNASYLARTLPEVFVSVPEPNKVEVEIYLYDKAGHKSKPILLRHVEVQ